MSRDHASAEERFRCLYAEHVDPILGFAIRRADQADDAAGIVAETVHSTYSAGRTRVLAAVTTAATAYR